MRSKSFISHGHCIPLRSETGLQYTQNFGHPEGTILIAASWVVFALCSLTSWWLD